MNSRKLKPECDGWHLDLCRHGTPPHAGFGVGFECLPMLLTGVSNLRDVILFAWTTENGEF